MISLLLHLISWPAAAIALFLFGFAPGAALRLIVLAFPRDDARRRELLAEVYNIPRLDQPFWVVQQLEVALFEGVGGRIKAFIVRHRIRQRVVSGLRSEKDDFLNSTYTVGEHIAGFSLMGTGAYIYIYLHVSKASAVGLTAMGLWFICGVIRAHVFQRYMKRCKHQGVQSSTNRLDRLIVFAAAPPLYLLTAYSFVRDIVVLAEGRVRLAIGSAFSYALSHSGGRGIW